eukprot:12025776-Alexandrium_andersonii.AAC.1
MRKAIAGFDATGQAAPAGQAAAGVPGGAPAGGQAPAVAQLGPSRWTRGDDGSVIGPLFEAASPPAVAAME